MNTRIVKKLDSVVGPILTALIPSPEQPVLAAPPASVLVIRPGGIGDAVLLAPALNCLKKKLPNARITVLAERRNAGVFQLVPAADRVLCYDTPKGLYEALRDSYELVIDTEQWHRLSAVVARMIRADSRFGFTTNERSRMFTRTFPYSHDDYETDSFARLFEPICGEMKFSPPFLTVPQDARQSARTKLKPLNDKSYVVLFPGASIPERRWGAARFRGIAERLEADGYSVVAVGAATDMDDGAVICGGTGLNMAGKTSLAETAAILEGSALLIAGDSGVLHIAAGLGIPTISLFGPGRQAKWGPRGENHRIINLNLPCSPCTTFGTTPECSTNGRCMQEITVDTVWGVLKQSHLCSGRVTTL
mgnify:FL=1